MGRGVFEHFDFSALDDPSFKEDAVREEIVALILRRLGYTPTGTWRVQRSKALAHPFVMIGSKKHRVSIIPDYILFEEDEPLAVLDAKAPTESIVASKHVEQVYSYAIHPDIRCDHYGLCNGRELVLYNTREWEPVFRIGVQEMDGAWEAVVKHLTPRYLRLPELRDFLDDFGLHAHKAGIEQTVRFVFVDYWLQDLRRVADDLFTSSGTHQEPDREMMVSFDFGQAVLDQLLGGLPADAAHRIRREVGNAPFSCDLDPMVRATLVGNLGELTDGAFEAFVPIIVSEVTGVALDTSLKSEIGKEPDQL